ncbi:MAG: citrate lyase holo-[Clostridia bacterium]|nr:citrate lyase holo-[acyl-carrier protein] synthase [Clostridia bacterium]
MMNTIRHVSVEDMLSARDARAARQESFRLKYRAALISYTLNIPGDIKYDDDIRRAFEEGKSRILRQLERVHAAALDFTEVIAFTGCEALWAVDFDAPVLKEKMCLIEEADALGRLFDIDVIDAAGTHLSRGIERTCLICGAPVRACARARSHDAKTLFAKAKEIIKSHFELQFIRSVGEAAQRALLHEALTTPKPGLVDRENNGAHDDMDLFSFVDSACALRSYFEDCVHLGLKNAPHERLQHLGMQAEDKMFTAARANTHKGAVFSLGILCYAMGRCGEGAALDTVLGAAAQAGAYFLAQMQKNAHPLTGGEKQYRQYGLTGARGEAASGYESVSKISLPALKKALASGKSPEEAGLSALLSLIAKVQDSNIIRRAGMEGQSFAQGQACIALENGCSPEALRRMNDAFVARRISPGGSADLLAVTYFLHFLYP